MNTERSDWSLLVADDHPVFRLGLALALRQLGYGRVLEAEDGRVALRACRESIVDVAILDVKMPRVNGLDVIRSLRAEQTKKRALPRFIVMSAFDQPAVVKAGADLGVDAFLGKETSPDRLAEVIDAVMSGRRVRECQPATGIERLTPREREVLHRLCLGQPTKAIAASLGLAPDTVKDHLARLYAKLDVRDRAAAVDAAHRLGWTTLDDLSGQHSGMADAS